MNKYVKLMSNTVLFAIGSFSSKALGLLLVPLYSTVLDAGEIGQGDILVQTANLMIPIATAGILNAIIRFGLDRTVRKGDVFTTGLIVIACAFTVSLAGWPVVSWATGEPEYSHLVYLYTLTSAMRSLCSQFVRTKGYVRLYAVDGVLATLYVVVFTALFLPVMRLGIIGFILPTILSDLCSALFLFVTARLWHYVRLRRGMRWTVREMIRYSLPLVPTTISWWVMNMSCRYFVSKMLGLEENGLLAIAYRIPMVINVVSTIFNDAWQMSAVSDVKSEEERADFFSKVFAAFQSVVFLAASGLILMDKVVIQILVLGKPDLYPAWRYIPILVVAAAFSCMVTFLGSVYMVEKRSVMSLITTLVGAGLNVLLCFAFIPVFQVNGAALAMLLSYATVFVMRAISAQQMVHMRWSIPKMALNLAIVSAQTVILLKSPPLWILWEILLTVASMVLNLRPIVIQAARFLQSRKTRG